MDSLNYELPATVVTSDELEERIAPMYEKLRIPPGQIESLTGIHERRWWDSGYPLSEGAAAAGRKALAESNVSARDIEALIYCGVCRENFEPATACAVAELLGIRQDVFIYDISNACLGVLNGIIDIANRIELKQIRAGMVVSCESAREIIDVMIQRMLDNPTIEMFTSSLATLTGGSGATAIILTDGSFQKETGPRLLGAANRAAPEHHRLCRWGITMSPAAVSDLIFSPDKLKATIGEILEPEALPSALRDIMTHEKLPSIITRLLPSEKLPAALSQFMTTDSASVLKHGIELGVNTWSSFLKTMDWARDQVDKVICHQVGAGHRATILKTLGIPEEKDFSSYKHLGNIGTVSLPLTAALADQRNFLKNGDRVGFMGIGSGLNCLMLGWKW